MDQHIRNMHAKQMKLKFRQKKMPRIVKDTPRQESDSSKDNNFANTSTGVNMEASHSRNQSQVEASEQLSEDLVVGRSNLNSERVKNQLLLTRLKAMATANKNKKVDITNCDIQLIKVCLGNLANYFSKETDKMQVLQEVSQKIASLNSHP